MKVVIVEMWAYQDGAIREVRIPDEATGTLDNMLNAAFHYGQNDIQPVPDRCSVSVGDVIVLDDGRYLVAALGFKKLTAAEYEQHKSLTPLQRALGMFGYVNDTETEGQS